MLLERLQYHVADPHFREEIAEALAMDAQLIGVLEDDLRGHDQSAFRRVRRAYLAGAAGMAASAIVGLAIGWLLRAQIFI